MNDEKFRFIGALLILISIFLPMTYVVVISTGNEKKGFDNTTFHIHKWMFGLNYIIAEGDKPGNWLSFSINWVGTIIMIIYIVFGIIILKSNNQDNGTRIMALSTMILIFRILSLLVIVVSTPRPFITSSGSSFEYRLPHIGFFVIIIGCILALIGRNKSTH